ncbi:MAG: hypothetical protein GF311_23300 [Candidatus Lokiarchaeota archaeon]|nr:hypothetical protein [Candidatus Lokiarchaeota archaeon]
MVFTQIEEQYYMYENYVSVYDLKSQDKVLLIDLGSGEVLNTASLNKKKTKQY